MRLEVYFVNDLIRISAVIFFNAEAQRFFKIFAITIFTLRSLRLCVESEHFSFRRSLNVCPDHLALDSFLRVPLLSPSLLVKKIGFEVYFVNF
jgi:hypothetical protein